MKKEFKITAIVVAVIFVFMLVVFLRQDKTEKVVEEQAVPKERRALDGVFVEKGKENPPIAGVMIENMIEAQPLSGIADATLVFEAVVEASITRFLAYFVLPETPSNLPAGKAGSPSVMY